MRPRRPADGRRRRSLAHECRSGCGGPRSSATTPTAASRSTYVSRVPQLSGLLARRSGRRARSRTDWQVVSSTGKSLPPLKKTREEADALSRSTDSAARSARQPDLEVAPVDQEWTIRATGQPADSGLRFASESTAKARLADLRADCRATSLVTAVHMAGLACAARPSARRRAGRCGSSRGGRPMSSPMAGIARTFQNIRLFQNMTVLENVLVGMDRRFPKQPACGMIFRTPGMRRAEAAAEPPAVELLEFVGLADKQANCWPRTCPMATSGGWRSPARWPAEPRAAVARRAGGRHEPVRVARSDAPDPPDPRPGHHGPADRASHEAGDGHFRSHRRARLRREDRRRDARGSARQSRR